MNIILNNNPIIIKDILPKHLSYKYYLLLLMSNKYYYIDKPSKIQFEKIYYTPKSYIELYTAVTLWCNDRNQALINYEHISRWNTLYITNMSFLFYNHPMFNDNIDDWIVYKVNDYRYIFRSSIKRNQILDKNKIKNMKNIIHMFKS